MGKGGRRGGRGHRSHRSHHRSHTTHHHGISHSHHGISHHSSTFGSSSHSRLGSRFGNRRPTRGGSGGGGGDDCDCSSEDMGSYKVFCCEEAMTCLDFGFNCQPILPSYFMDDKKHAGLCGESSMLPTYCGFLAFFFIGLGLFSFLEAAGNAADGGVPGVSGTVNVPMRAASTPTATCTYRVPSANRGRLYYLAAGVEGPDEVTNVIAYDPAEFQNEYGSEYGPWEEGCTMLDIVMEAGSGSEQELVGQVTVGEVWPPVHIMGQVGQVRRYSSRYDPGQVPSSPAVSVRVLREPRLNGGVPLNNFGRTTTRPISYSRQSCAQIVAQRSEPQPCYLAAAKLKQVGTNTLPRPSAFDDDVPAPTEPIYELEEVSADAGDNEAFKVAKEAPYSKICVSKVGPRPQSVGPDQEVEQAPEAPLQAAGFMAAGVSILTMLALAAACSDKMWTRSSCAAVCGICGLTVVLLTAVLPTMMMRAALSFGPAYSIPLSHTSKKLFDKSTYYAPVPTMCAVQRADWVGSTCKAWFRVSTINRAVTSPVSNYAVPVAWSDDDFRGYTFETDGVRADDDGVNRLVRGSSSGYGYFRYYGAFVDFDRVKADEVPSELSTRSACEEADARGRGVSTTDSAPVEIPCWYDRYWNYPPVIYDGNYDDSPDPNDFQKVAMDPGMLETDFLNETGAHVFCDTREPGQLTADFQDYSYRDLPVPSWSQIFFDADHQTRWPHSMPAQYRRLREALQGELLATTLGPLVPLTVMFLVIWARILCFGGAPCAFCFQPATEKLAPPPWMEAEAAQAAAASNTTFNPAVGFASSLGPATWSGENKGTSDGFKLKTTVMARKAFYHKMQGNHSALFGRQTQQAPMAQMHLTSSPAWKAYKQCVTSSLFLAATPTINQEVLACLRSMEEPSAKADREELPGPKFTETSQTGQRVVMPPTAPSTHPGPGGGGAAGVAGFVGRNPLPGAMGQGPDPSAPPAMPYPPSAPGAGPGAGAGTGVGSDDAAVAKKLQAAGETGGAGVNPYPAPGMVGAPAGVAPYPGTGAGVGLPGAGSSPAGAGYGSFPGTAAGGHAAVDPYAAPYGAGPGAGGQGGVAAPLAPYPTAPQQPQAPGFGPAGGQGQAGNGDGSAAGSDGSSPLMGL